MLSLCGSVVMLLLTMIAFYFESLNSELLSYIVSALLLAHISLLVNVWAYCSSLPELMQLYMLKYSCLLMLQHTYPRDCSLQCLFSLFLKHVISKAESTLKVSQCFIQNYRSIRPFLH